MVKNFQNKFGSPKNTIFVMGDHDKGNYHMKGIEPVISKKFRKIFRNAGYKTFLVNEFRTSKLCNCCNEELEHFLERTSQKPKRKRNMSWNITMSIG
jgi:transposase